MKKNQEEDWLKLDNAAKIYPANASKRDTRVYRIACSLKEDINRNILQKATNMTLNQFPHFKSILKKGLFWYYLDFSNLKPIIEEEHQPICAPIYDRYQKNLLFKVTYYKKRINLEVFHALADGAGAIEFLRALVANYLILKHPLELQNKKIDLEYNASISDKMDDSFHKYYDAHGKKKSNITKPAYILKGTKHKENRIEVIEGFASTASIKEQAKKYDTTITIFLCAILMSAINDTMNLNQRKKSVVLTIPVNLRQYFKSHSARNFFGIFNVGYNFSKKQSDTKSIITYLNKFFQEKLNYEEMSIRINSMMALEKSIILRSIPIFIKDIVLKLAYNIAEKNNTAALSNVGIIKMPEILNDYIEYFDVFVSTNKLQMCMCSYNDALVMSFTSPFKNTDIQKNFFRNLAKYGVELKVTSNFLEKETEDE